MTPTIPLTATAALSGKIALVTGASRGIGRGIALQLGSAGATVYVTGRKSSDSYSRRIDSLPRLDETAKEINERGGKGIPLYIDHSDMNEVKGLFEKIEEETNGKLNILVNNAYSGVPTIVENIGQKFFKCPPEMWDDINNVGLRNVYYCSVYAARMMDKRMSGLIINISSAAGLKYIFNVPYGVGKQAIDRLSEDMAVELKDRNVAVISLWPMAVKTELTRKIYEKKGTVMGSEEMGKSFSTYESTEYVGKTVVALASDPKIMKKTGKVYTTADMGAEYDFKDIDGRDPPNLRSLSVALNHLGYKWAASFIPKWIKIPGIIIWMTTSRL